MSEPDANAVRETAEIHRFPDSRRVREAAVETGRAPGADAVVLTWPDGLRTWPTLDAMLADMLTGRTIAAHVEACVARRLQTATDAAAERAVAMARAAWAANDRRRLRLGLVRALQVAVAAAVLAFLMGQAR